MSRWFLFQKYTSPSTTVRCLPDAATLRAYKHFKISVCVMFGLLRLTDIKKKNYTFNIS